MNKQKDKYITLDMLPSSMSALEDYDLVTKNKNYQKSTFKKSMY